MGLDNIQRLHDLLGRPLDDPGLLVVHVAGTNGKGSVALKVAKTLELHGLRTGIFVSPHVSSFRERMQVNSTLIGEEHVVRLLPEVYRLCEEHGIPATFFEITTALAFMFFLEEKCQAVVLETGLGGRLDATNVVKSPALAVITSIGLEHTRILGDTIEMIAKEKAGIIKAGRPVLVGPNVPHAVLRQCAIDKQASRYYTVDDVLPGTSSASRPCAAAGRSQADEDDPEDYDVENTRIAIASLKLVQESFPDIVGDLSDETVKVGTSVRPPCRFEVLEVPSSSGGGAVDEAESQISEAPSPLTVILDVAHNPPAMMYMVRKLRRTYPNRRIRVVVGMSSDKDMRLCGESLLEAVNGDPSRIHLVEAAHPRAATLEAILNATGLVEAHYDLDRRSVTEQMSEAMRLARRNGEILVVCGSVFLMAEAREAIGIDEPRDSACIAEVAGAGFRHSQENFGNETTSTSSMPVAV
jgi:dihydrofolate synthase/folylpolyglutamate synthase